MTGDTPPLLRWRFTLNGDVRHYVNVNDGRAICGLWPMRQGPQNVWYGNASKLEIDTILRMPACKHCLSEAKKL